VPNWFQYRLRNSLRGRGYEILKISPSLRADSLLALHLHKLFKRLDINCVIDVGARIGDYGLWIRRNGYSGKIVSFEPVSESFKQLQSRCTADRNWSAHPIALGSRNENSRINVTRATNFSSFLTPNQYSVDQFGEQVSINHTESVEVRRLEDVWELVASDTTHPRVYLKMDTQGWDVEVLRGASSALTHVLALQTEVSVQPIYTGMSTYLDSMDYLRGLGFEVSGLFPVNLDDSMRVVEFDCVAVRASSPELRASVGRGSPAERTGPSVALDLATGRSRREPV
jgi:FkbM family methyltransferase